MKSAGKNSSISADIPISSGGVDLSFPSLSPIPIALLLIGDNGRIIECNPAALELFGTKSAEILIDKPLMEFLSVMGTTLMDNPVQVYFPVVQKQTLVAKFRQVPGREGFVRILFMPAGDTTSTTLAMLEEIAVTEPGENTALRLAYQDQKYLNQKLGEILELSRTFSLYLNLERAMNQIVRVVGESLGYGLVGLYLKEEKSDRTRVATYIDTSIDITTIEPPNPGMDWELLKHITGNSSDLKMIGGKRVRIKFGDDTYRAGEEAARSDIPGSSEIWQLDEYLLALVRLEGSVASGFIRVSHSLKKPNTGSLIKKPPFESEVFCQQALWIFASQASVAIENALLFEKAQVEIDERKQTEKELDAAKIELEKHIHTRTLRLEKVNQDLQDEIRKRESTQIELDGQKEFLRQVLDTNPTLIFVRDRTGRYLLVNEATAKFEGLAVDDFNGRMVNDFTHDISQIIRWRHEDLDVLDNNREMILTEEHVRDSHGREHFFQTIKRPILSATGNSDLVLGVSVDITALKRAEERAIQANVDLAQAYDETILGWARALDIRDHETEAHSTRVTKMTLKLARVLGVDPSEYRNLQRGALLHDIGKMGIPDEILRKRGRLDEAEWVEMRKHPIYAYNMLNPIAYLRPAILIPKYHHEKWDGSGYPEKLQGEMIPLAARIFAVVDVWEALSSQRPYRDYAWEKEKIVEYISGNSGKHFDPMIANVFLQHLDEIVTSN